MFQFSKLHVTILILESAVMRAVQFILFQLYKSHYLYTVGGGRKGSGVLTRSVSKIFLVNLSVIHTVFMLFLRQLR